MEIGFSQYGFSPDSDPTVQGFSPNARGGLICPILDMDNLYPTQRGYRQLPGLAVVSNALTSPANGLFLAVSSGGSEAIYAGTTNHLWKLLDGMWTVVDDGSLVPTTGRWRFAQFLDDVIAVDSVGENPPQVSHNGGLFGPLGGNPPRGAIIATVDVGGIGIFAFLFNFNGFADIYGTSGIDNDADWNFSIQTLGSAQRESSVPGPWTGASSLHALMVAFKVNGVAVGQFQAGAIPWNFQFISKQVGCASNEAIVNTGDLLAFVGNDNFYTTDGGGVYPIPNQLRDWFFRTLDRNFAGSILSEYDQQNAVAYWHFASVNANPRGTIDTWIAWHLLSGRWTKGMEPLAGGVTATVGSLPLGFPLTWTEFGNKYLSPTWSSVPAGLLWGSPSFRGSPINNRAIIGPDGVLRSYSGPVNQRGYILTGDNGYMERLTQVNRLMAKFAVLPNSPPLGSNAKLSTYIKDQLGDQASPNQNGLLFRDQVNIGPQGWFDFIESARWHRFKIEVSTDAEFIGYALQAVDGGER